MRFVKQFFIIALVSFAGEILSRVLPLPVPASVYGLVLMFAALKAGIVPLGSVREAGSFLLDAMPLMFVPPAIGILASLDVLKAHWWQLLVIASLSTFAVMGVSGVVTQAVMRALGRRRCASAAVREQAEIPERVSSWADFVAGTAGWEFGAWKGWREDAARALFYGSEVAHGGHGRFFDLYPYWDVSSAGGSLKNSVGADAAEILISASRTGESDGFRSADAAFGAMDPPFFERLESFVVRMESESWGGKNGGV